MKLSKFILSRVSGDIMRIRNLLFIVNTLDFFFMKLKNVKATHASTVIYYQFRHMSNL